MLIHVTTVVAALMAVGFMFIGAHAFRSPQSATGFGIPDSPVADPTFQAWLRVKGTRDLVCGGLVLVLMAVATPAVLGWYLLGIALIPVGDMLVVLRSGGPRAAAYGVHGATALAVLVVAVLLLLG